MMQGDKQERGSWNYFEEYGFQLGSHDGQIGKKNCMRNPKKFRRT